jgi:hypothetical protein
LRTPIAKYLKRKPMRSARRHSGRAHACWAGINLVSFPVGAKSLRDAGTRLRGDLENADLYRQKLEGPTPCVRSRPLNTFSRGERISHAGLDSSAAMPSSTFSFMAPRKPQISLRVGSVSIGLLGRRLSCPQWLCTQPINVC